MEEIEWLNPWDHQMKRIVGTSGVYPCLNANSGGGGRTDGVCYALEGNTVDRENRQNGRGWCQDVSPSLNTQDRHGVCYSADLRNGVLNEELSGTLQAHTTGGYSVNCTHPVMYEK